MNSLLTEIERVDIMRKLSVLEYTLSQTSPNLQIELVREHEDLNKYYYTGLKRLIEKYELKEENG